MFTRTHLIAEVAPRLYGRDPAELDRVLDHIARQPRGRPAHRRRPAPASRPTPPSRSSTAEADHRRDRRAPRRPRRPGRRPRDQVADAIAGQGGDDRPPPHRRPDDAVVERVCSLGPGGRRSSSVSPAPGKTTALDAATTALEAAGYRVLGTSTSGQAARTLGTEAGIEARTLRVAALAPRPRPDHPRRPHRRDRRRSRHGRRRRPRPPRPRRRTRRRDARPRRRPPPARRRRPRRRPRRAPRPPTPSSSSPSTTTSANTTRPNAHALAELRARLRPDGRRLVRRATAASTPTPNRTDTLVAMADAWAADVAAGHDTALLAWRRARRRRPQPPRPRTTGTDSATSPATTSSRPAAAATPSATASSPSPPTPTPGIVTSERLTVTAVDAPTHRRPSPTDGRAVVAHRRRRSTPTTSTTATPSPSTAPKAPPTTAPTSSPPAAAESSPTSP